MNLSLRNRLFLNGLMIILLGMGLAGFLFWRAAEGLYLSTQTENLMAQARLTAAALQGQTLPTIPAETYSQVANVMPGMHTRVLSEEGAVIIGLPMTGRDAPFQMTAAENYQTVSPEELMKRPEIISARQGEAASAIREVLPEKHRVLYAAAPIFSNDGSINGLVYMAVPLPAGGLPADFLNQLMLAGLAAVFLALLAGTFLARRITAPVTAIIQGAAGVSKGDMDQIVPEKSGIRELDSLGQAFNQMVANLRQSDQAQNAFVADVAHELRTPLTVIKGTIETLEDGALDDLEGRGPLLSSMQRETDRLIRLVNNLLILTRADAGMLKLKLERLDLAELAQRRCDHLAGLATQNGVIFEVKAAGSVTVRGDEDRLAQVLDNLLNNAIRYSPPGGIITVDVSDDGKECCFRVHDHGPGIPEKHLPYIFERFYRADMSRSRQGGEAGLGLSIARSLIHAHNGRIIAESKPGNGATFIFWLPSGQN